MADCPICQCSLSAFDEPAAAHHVERHFVGEDIDQRGHFKDQYGSAAIPDGRSPIFNASAPAGSSVNDHVEAGLLLSQSQDADASQRRVLGPTSDEDACPSCFIEWSALDVDLFGRDLHVGNCLAQRQALMDDAYLDSKDGQYFECTDEQQPLSLLSSNGVQNGFGKLRSSIKGKFVSDPITPNLIPQLSLLLNRAFSSNSAATRSAVLCNSNACHFRSQPSDFGWGCGYRNAQMVISALRHVNQYRHIFIGRTVDQHSDDVGNSGSRSTNGAKRKDSPTLHTFAANIGGIPSIPDLQEIAEKAWSAGFDPEGFKHFKGKLVGSRRWIGTSEVYVMLTFLGVR